MAAGAASGSIVVDPLGDLVVLVVGDGRSGIVALVQAVLEAVATAGTGGALIAGHEVAEDLLGDLSVRSISPRASGGASKRTMWYDPRVAGRSGRQTARPTGRLDDLATGRHEGGWCGDDRLSLVVRDVGTQDQMEFVSRMRQFTPSNGDRPADGTAGAEPKGNGDGV